MQFLKELLSLLNGGKQLKFKKKKKMGNYTGEINLLTKKVSKKNPKKALVEIIDELDSDYEDFSEEIVEAIINKRKNVKQMIEDVIKGNFKDLTVEEDGEIYDADISTFILKNCTYCSGYEYEIEEEKNHFHLSLSYGT